MNWLRIRLTAYSLMALVGAIQPIDPSFQLLWDWSPALAVVTTLIGIIVFCSSLLAFISVWASDQRLRAPTHQQVMFSFKEPVICLHSAAWLAGSAAAGALFSSMLGIHERWIDGAVMIVISSCVLLTLRVAQRVFPSAFISDAVPPVAFF